MASPPDAVVGLETLRISKFVWPLLYAYRVLLTGIHLMRPGVMNAKQPEPNEGARLTCIADLNARKRIRVLAFGHHTLLEDAAEAFHQREY